MTALKTKNSKNELGRILLAVLVVAVIVGMIASSLF